jgi:hypothetical protein
VLCIKAVTLRNQSIESAGFIVGQSGAGFGFGGGNKRINLGLNFGALFGHAIRQSHFGFPFGSEQNGCNRVVES